MPSRMTTNWILTRRLRGRKPTFFRPQSEQKNPKTLRKTLAICGASMVGCLKRRHRAHTGTLASFILSGIVTYFLLTFLPRGRSTNCQRIGAGIVLLAWHSGIPETMAGRRKDPLWLALKSQTTQFKGKQMSEWTCASTEPFKLQP